jgi:hypothetical protein
MEMSEKVDVEPNEATAGSRSDSRDMMKLEPQLCRRAPAATRRAYIGRSASLEVLMVA